MGDLLLAFTKEQDVMDENLVDALHYLGEGGGNDWPQPCVFAAASLICLCMPPGVLPAGIYGLIMLSTLITVSTTIYYFRCAPSVKGTVTMLQQLQLQLPWTRLMSVGIARHVLLSCCCVPFHPSRRGVIPALTALSLGKLCCTLISLAVGGPQPETPGPCPLPCSVFAGVLILVTLFMLVFYLPAAAQLKKHRTQTGGDLVGLVAETLEGLAVVQAFDKTNHFVQWAVKR